ncbi:DUF2977 domain-containing protein [Staphylococcus aureus]|uniref:DUF2977 domain-containing protein n=1 Tax=Staphylococcus aureus TaxID=1280 RepID=UPI0004527589|nr:DUF2977 domain-containing protein [Staphylococcus aureus]EGQ0540360.1 DUF2977 domain-containing protein [Staphylococcus aureus]EZY77529.1 hypothetical protein V066_02570 [Staphylococcus aureus R0615]MBH4710898.1 DUF2977 domain-containing protein [Staphylococcus aureus]MBH4716237.1 DUF2977 domain-containing protein [Staphylococcus aureus]MBH4719610.1 DUF2977 domain-containing protein [Staphylococcus aureus]
MQILMNKQNEIISFALIGGFEGGVYVEQIPDNFSEMFQPKAFKYDNGEIVANEAYANDTGEQNSRKDPFRLNDVPLDSKLMHMLASIQKQVTQMSKVSLQTSKQNAMMAQQIVKLNKELEEKKGGAENA